MGRRGLLGPPNTGKNNQGAGFGGLLPSVRPHYHPATASALHALAELRPPWPEYLRERQRILEAK